MCAWFAVLLSMLVFSAPALSTEKDLPNFIIKDEKEDAANKAYLPTEFTETVYETIKMQIETDNPDFADILNDELSDTGVILDEDAGLELIEMMQPVFNFLTTTYDVPEELVAEYHNLHLLAWHRLLPLTRVLQMSWNDDNFPTVYWCNDQITTGIYQPLEETFECITERLKLPYNYEHFLQELKRIDLEAENWFSLVGHDQASIYNQLIQLHNIAVILRDFVIGLAPTFAKSDNLKNEIGLIEKRVLYRGLDKINSMVQAQIQSGTIDDIMQHAPFKSLWYDSINAIAEVVGDIHEAFELFAMMEEEFDYAISVSQQLIINLVGPVITGGVEWTDHLRIDETGVNVVYAWVPVFLNTKIEEIDRVVDDIKQKIDRIGTLTTQVNPDGTIDFIPVYPFAYFDFQVGDDHLDETPGLSWVDDVEKGVMMEIPEGTDVTYRCTFPGLEAKPEFWQHAHRLEIRIQGNLPSSFWNGWDGIELIQSVEERRGGYLYSEARFALGEGTVTESGRQWVVHLNADDDDGTGLVWNPDDPQWVMPWHYNKEDVKQIYTPLFIQIHGNEGIQIQSIDIKLYPETAAITGEVRDENSVAIASHMEFKHASDSASGLSAPFKLEAETVAQEDGTYTIHLPVNGDTVYKVALDGQVCNITPDAFTAQDGEQSFVLGEALPVTMVVEAPAFSAPAYDGDPWYFITNQAVDTLTGYIDTGCAAQTTRLYYIPIPDDGSRVSLSLTVDSAIEGRYHFSHAINWNPEMDMQIFSLEITDNTGFSHLIRQFQISAPTSGLPSIGIGDGYTTFTMDRLTEVGETFQVPIWLENIGTVAPEIAYFSLSASPGVAIRAITFNQQTVQIDPEIESQADLANTYDVNNYPIGSTIWNVDGETMIAVYQLVDIRGESVPNISERHRFVITLEAQADAIDRAQWFQYRAAFKRSEQDQAEYQAIQPDWDDTPLRDQQGWPVMRIEAEAVQPSGDQFPDDPAASVDSDLDGHPDYWDPSATPTDILNSSLTIDAAPYDPAVWDLQTGSSGSLDLRAAEYFIDVDPGIGKANTFSCADAILDQPFEFFDKFQIPTHGLSPGVHLLGVRIKNANGQWSPVKTATFHLIEPAGGNSETPFTNENSWKDYPHISQAELFFGDDPGIGLATQLIPTDEAFDRPIEQFEYETIFPEAREGSEVVSLSLRVKDSNGTWSPLQTILVDQDRDGDGSADYADAFPDDPAASLDSDGDGRPNRWNDNATPEEIAQSSLLIDHYPFDPTRWELIPGLRLAEYFIDEDPGVGNGHIVLAHALYDKKGFGFFERFNIPTDTLQPGAHILYVRIQDSNYNWSETRSAGFEIIEPTCGNDMTRPVPFGMADFQTLASAEWFLGADPGEGNGNAIEMPLTPSSILQVDIEDLDYGTLRGTQDLSVRIQHEDGTWSPISSAKVIIGAPGTNQPPEIVGTIPDQTKDEDDAAWTFDLTEYESDTEDSGTALNWSVGTVSGSLFTAAITDLDEDILTMTPVADASGSEVITLTLTDSGGLTDTQDITVTLNAVNDPPDQPFGENPTHGATGVSINADLGWSGSDPENDALTFDVYFGTANPPTISVATGQSDLTYDPGTLRYSTTYYWQVDAEDVHDAQTEGSVWHFTTEAEPNRLPGVTTQTPTEITTTTATGHGTITDTGVPAATDHGVCWNTTGNPDISDSHTSEGAVTSTGVFTSSISGLSPDTTYYVRAYATNPEGTVYGDTLTFTTERSPAGFYVGTISGNTGEDGTAATFTISLTAAPHDDVTLSLYSSDEGEGIVNPTSLTFTPTNWNVDQTVTVTGVDDTVEDGNQPFEIRFGAAVSADTAYNGLTPDPVSVINIDNDGNNSGKFLPFIQLLLD